MRTTTFQSLHDLQLAMPRILEEHGDDIALTRIALANPLVALERAGYSFTPKAREEIEEHIRFGKNGAVKYNETVASLREKLGKDVDLDDPALPSSSLMKSYREMVRIHPPLAAEKDIPHLEERLKKMPFTKVTFSMNRKKS